MKQASTNTNADATELLSGKAWFDLIEANIRERVYRFIEELLKQELTVALSRSRCERAAVAGKLRPS